MPPNAKQKKLGPFGAFALSVLIFSVARGVVPLFLGNSELARPTYTFSFVLGICLSLHGLYLALFKKDHAISKQPRLLLITNLILTIFWWIPVIIFNPERNLVISLVYTAIFPFSVFGFARLPEKYLTAALAIITLIVAGTVMWDFIELNTALIPGGYALAANRQLLLRPETFSSFGRTGELLRPVGILGDRPHDAANLLAILSSYWIALLFRKGRSKVALCAISALGVSAMLMTQSASNITAFFVGLLFIMTAYRRKLFSFGGTRSLLTVLAAGLIMLYVFAHFLGIQPGMLWQWSQRVGPSGSWQDMTALGITNINTDLLTLFIGHGSSLGLSKVGDVTELGFLKILMESGLISCVIFLSLLSYPVGRYILFKGPNNQSRVPYIAPLVVGFVSLWHYGSVLRTTNIFVFFALYAHALKISPESSLSNPRSDLERAAG